MSRTLSKILVICAMVVLFPLMIVGTAFVAYYSIDASVEVSVYTNATSVSADAYAKVVYNNKSDVKFSITQSHISELNLGVVSKGYDFVGWFDGDLEAYAIAHASNNVEFVSEEESFKSDIKTYEKLLAVFEIKQYTVQYSYKSDPTVDDVTTETPNQNDGNATSETFNYGDVLPVLTYGGIEYTFGGWKIDGDSTNTQYNEAIFSTETNIVLTAIWNRTTEVSVNYHGIDRTQVLKTEKIFVNQDYSLIDAKTFANNQSLFKKGYSYSWQDENGNVLTSLSNQTSDVDVYLQESEISYVTNVNLEDITFNGLETASVNFTINDMSGFEVLKDETKWGTEYSFYKVTGMRYNGNVYSLDKLTDMANKIVDDNPNGATGSVEVEAVLTKYFTKVNISNTINCYKALHETNKPNVYKSIYDIGSNPWNAPSGEKSSNISIFELLNATSASKFYDNDGAEVSISWVKVSIAGIKDSYDVTGTTTLNDLIQMICAEKELSLADTLEIESIDVYFE